MAVEDLLKKEYTIKAQGWAILLAAGVPWILIFALLIFIAGTGE